MIIDSHAHYNNNAYKKPCRYLSYDKDGYTLKEGDWEQLFEELLDVNIPWRKHFAVGHSEKKNGPRRRNEGII